MLSFSTIGQFLSMESDGRLLSIILSTSCLAMVSNVNTSEEASQLIDFTTGLNVKDKHLLIHMSSRLESDVLQKKRINFNIAISHASTGAKDLGL